jgi:hypothetical protein
MVLVGRKIHSSFLRCSVGFLTFGVQSVAMRVHKGRAAAVGILCAIAATVAVWSGPLFAASSALHANGQPPAQTVTHGQSLR